MSRLCDGYKYYAKNVNQGMEILGRNIFIKTVGHCVIEKKHFTKEYNDQSIETLYDSTAWD